MTRPGAIGVAFARQRRAVWRAAGATPMDHAIEPGAVFVSPEGLTWIHWTDISESVEMWLSPPMLESFRDETGRAFDPRPLDRAHDPVVVSLASCARRLLLSTCADNRIALEQIGWRLAVHLGNLDKPSAALGARRLRRAVAYIRDNLDGPLTLRDVADAAHASPFHFARMFAAATGSPPHAYIVARRMERAMCLLRETDSSVATVARQVGFTSGGHFRQHFVRHWGILPHVARE